MAIQTHQHKKKVIFVNFSKSWGGGEKWHFTAAQALMKRGYGVTVFTRINSALHYQAVLHGIPCLSWKMSPRSFLNPVLLVQLVGACRTLLADAVIVNGSIELKTAGLAAKLADIPHIIYRRSIPRPIRPTVLNRLLFKYVVTTLIVNSRHTLQAIQDIVAQTGQHPDVIYNGIVVHADTTCDTRSNTIGVVARLSSEKGVDRAMTAFSQVAKQIPNARLMIIGDGPERAALENYAARLQLRERILFIGFVENIVDYLQQCSILVLPSRWEGFGYALLEAMALKMPCVAFRQTAAEEVIEHGVTGYLIEPEDVRQLAECLIRLLHAPNDIAALGEAGYRRLTQHFSLTQTIDRLEEVLYAS